MINRRKEICSECPLCNDWICNAKLFLNPETNEVSKKPKEGFIKGCGCAILVKIKNINNHCPAKKW